MTEGAFRIRHDLTVPGSARLYSQQAGSGFVTGANRTAQQRLQIPETNTGFLPQWWHDRETLTAVADAPEGVVCQISDKVLPQEQEGRFLALSFRQDVPATGCYRVTLGLAAGKDTGEILVFVGRRRLVWHGSLQKGESRTLTALCDVSPIIPRGKTEPVSDPAVNIAILCGCAQRVHCAWIEIEAFPARTVYIMGDSTVTDQTANLPYAPGTSFGGWGQMLNAWLPEPLCVSNHAHSGLTTESFTESGHWDVMRALLKPGDICLMQFGHNDQKRPHLMANGGYAQWLHRYIRSLREAGVQPVLVTPLARNSWNADETYNDLLEEYAAAVQNVGREAGVPVIDLHGYSKGQLCRDGLEASKCWFFPGDYTHTNDFGAAKMAQFVAQQLCSVLECQPCDLAAWTPHPPFALLQPPEGCKLMPPASGRPDPVAPLRTDRPTEPLSRVETLDLVIQLMRFFPINVYNDLYEDVVGHETYAGTVQCAAQNHLIPKAWVCDGRLYPERPVTLADFLMVLIPAYAGRRSLGEPMPAPSDVPEAARRAVGLALRAKLVGEQEHWNRPLLRGQAAEICRNVVF